MVKNTREAMWKYVVKTDSCWIWNAAKNRKGYGQFRVAGKLFITHRLSWELSHGPITTGLHILHRCDRPSCVNPEHLFLGTNQDNVDDKMAKGRHNTFHRTACKQGHEYTAATVYTRRQDNSRVCLICARDRLRLKYNPAKRAQRYLAKKERGLR